MVLIDVAFSFKGETTRSHVSMFAVAHSTPTAAVPYTYRVVRFY